MYCREEGLRVSGRGYHHRHRLPDQFVMRSTPPWSVPHIGNVLELETKRVETCSAASCKPTVVQAVQDVLTVRDLQVETDAHVVQRWPGLRPHVLADVQRVLLLEQQPAQVEGLCLALGCC
eukprot:2428023-Amphidinium_carterae.3